MLKFPLVKRIIVRDIEIEERHFHYSMLHLTRLEVGFNVSVFVIFLILDFHQQQVC